MPATIELDRPARRESYLQHGSSFIDRLRTRLVQREILKRLPRTGGLRVLDLGCGYHAIYPVSYTHLDVYKRQRRS